MVNETIQDEGMPSVLLLSKSDVFGYSQAIFSCAVRFSFFPAYHLLICIFWSASVTVRLSRVKSA